ncbi:putative dipeptidase PepE [subsurface metagenome]
MINKKYVDKLCGIMVKNKIDGMMLGPSTDLEFLMDYSPQPDERFQALFLLSDKRYFYISPEITYEEIRDKLDDADIYKWGDHEEFSDIVVAAINNYKLTGKSIGVNNGIVAINLIDIKEKVDAKFINGHGILETLRIVKDESEIEKLRKATKLADEVMGESIDYIHPGITERDIKKKIEELFIQKGADGLSFEPIIASGPNSSMPHYCEDSRVIQEKDIIILDLGCKYKGYCSDTSRTVFVGGITDEEKKVYDIILRANKAGEETAKQGVKAEDVDKASRDIIKSEGYGQYFLNRTGHGIGISVHEAPYMKTGNKQILERGMAFSVEPGIYMQNKFGMRIEDIVVIGADGPEILNKFTKEMILIK